MAEPGYGQMLRNRYEGGGFGDPGRNELMESRAELEQHESGKLHVNCSMAECVNNAVGACALGEIHVSGGAKCGEYEAEKGGNEATQETKAKRKMKKFGKKAEEADALE